MNKETRGGSRVKGRGVEEVSGNATKKIASSHPSPPPHHQSKQIQSTIDSFSKRVNKGKRK